MSVPPATRTVRRRSNRLVLALALAWVLTALAVGTVMSADRQADAAAATHPVQTAAVAAFTPSPDESPLVVLALGAVAGTAAGVVTVRQRRSAARLRD